MTTFSPEQLEARRAHIHASDAPKILGVSPFGGERDVWWEKVHGATWGGSAATDLGSLLEPVLLSFAVGQLGGAKLRRNVVRSTGCFVATLDALVLGSDPRAHVEAKYRSVAHDWGDPDESDSVPDDVLVQIAVQMHCARTRVCHVPVLLVRGGWPRLHMYRVERDDDLVSAVVGRLEQWWTDHVVTMIEPPGEPPSFDLLRSLRRQPEAVAELDASIVEPLVVRRQEVVEQQKALDAERKLIERELISSLGEAQSGGWDGGVITYAEHERKGYTVAPTTYRRLNVQRQQEGGTQ
jgi:predicted phage-related endonuclease